MVDDVVLDDVVEEVAADEAKVTVDGGQGALDKGPALGVKVGDVGVGVVQVGDGDCQRPLALVQHTATKERLHTQPVVDPEVGRAIHQEDGLPADDGGRKVQKSADHDEAEI